MSVILRPWGRDDAGALRDAAAGATDLAAQFGGADLSSAEAAAAIEFRHGTAWMSYWLAPAARGKGYATRALLSLCDWAFGAGLHRLELGHRVNNPASCRVATAAGFRAEGIEREKLRYGAERFDVETHARLAGDPSPTGSPLAMAPRA